MIIVANYMMIEIITMLVMTHITILCVTLYLHRSQAHKSVTFHPIVAHAMRFWLWMTTGQITRQWVAVHRKHHRFTEVDGDPHSPHVFGFWHVMCKGAVLYHQASKDSVMVAQYGAGTPDDWIERNVYSKHSRLGIALMLLINLAVFGAWGLLIWGIQMIWIPLWAAGVVNGIGHWWGYRNGKTKDKSRNIMPWGIVIGGECLHNNHHLEPGNPRLSRRWFEFDIGWMWLSVFRLVGLAKLR